MSFRHYFLLYLFIWFYFFYFTKLSSPGRTAVVPTLKRILRLWTPHMNFGKYIYPTKFWENLIRPSEKERRRRNRSSNKACLNLCYRSCCAARRSKRFCTQLRLRTRLDNISSSVSRTYFIMTSGNHRVTAQRKIIANFVPRSTNHMIKP